MVTYDELLTMLEDVQFDNLVFSQRVKRNYKLFVETMIKNGDQQIKMEEALKLLCKEENKKDAKEKMRTIFR